MSDYRGRVVYINFWATWCEPCVVEMPEIAELQDRNPETLAVISVNRRQDPDDAETFLEELPTTDGGQGVSFEVDGLDPDDTLYERYVRLFPEPMPVSIFIDADGVVSSVFNGIIRLPEMEQAVTEALASTSAAGTR
jgi:cytochrome c-type biogenesis protein